MIRLGVVVASTRENRAGRPIADWFVEIAQSHGGYEVVLLDLKEIPLPLLDEPHHPRLQKYVRPETKAWSAMVSAQDAFVFVTPEYNFGSPPALVNALDHLYVEWNYKAAGFVSYGGASGGTRSVQMTKQILTTLKMVPLVEAVAVPFYMNEMDKEAWKFKGGAAYEKAARTMLDELVRWTAALRSLRGA